MKISIEMVATQNTNNFEIDLEDLGLSIEEWNELNQEEKNDILNDWCCNLPEQPYWYLDKFKEVE